MPGTKHLHFFLKIHVCFLWTKWYVLLDAIQTQISIKRKAKASASLSCPVALPMWLLGPEDQEASKGLLQLEPYQEALVLQLDSMDTSESFIGGQPFFPH